MNLLDYLQWRNDIPFSVSPFNDVDNVVLSELAYVDFDNYFDSTQSFKPIVEIEKEYFTDNDYEDIKENATLIDRAPLLLREMVQGERFQNIEIGHYVNEIDQEKDKQFAAVIFKIDEETYYVAFRGTDKTIVGWKEDFKMSYMNEVEGAKSAVEYINNYVPKLKGRIIVGGHSKGGNLAVYGSAFCEKQIQEKIVQVYTNDGPGFREEIVASPEYKTILPKVVSIIPESAVIGLLLLNEYEHKVIKSSENGIMQHDALSWEVEKTGFVQTQLSKESQVFEKAVGHWLENIDDETRESVVTSVFSAIESTGFDTFDEVEEQKWQSAESIFSSLYNLSKEKQSDLTTSIKEMFTSMGKAKKETKETPKE